VLNQTLLFDSVQPDDPVDVQRGKAATGSVQARQRHLCSGNARRARPRRAHSNITPPIYLGSPA
jgi:hypothetical protein